MSLINDTFHESSVFADFALNASSNWTRGNGTLPAGRTSIQYVQEPLVSTVFKVLACAIVIILSLVGNSLAIGSVYQNVNRRMRTVSNYLIVNLSIADLLVTVCNMPRFISILLVGYQWLIGGTFGLLMCKITSSVPFVSVLVSTLSFAFIALDRFLAVFFPLRRPMTGKIMVGIIAFTWILPCCCYSLLFHYATLAEIYGKTYCANAIRRDLLETMENYRTYLICDYVFTTGVPIATTMALYTAIGVKMCTRKPLGIKRLPIRPATVRLTARFFMSYSNSAITPYIYPVFNANFRAGYLHILRRVLSCCFGRICPSLSNNQVAPLQERTGTTNSSRTDRRGLNTTEL
ncbi:hypothetical protein OS493_034340 [Desmophyllum pertusum]|uniref:G-protein coupled receptors family 1 profile domain-containing protein n=1 Tax=Desmophyllum pertusum TaxID=174260 RepID=A0A9W9Y9D8_9CNID|nr:hypothetical protein OS493_034340 [Desmophyllum pertusum]